MYKYLAMQEKWKDYYSLDDIKRIQSVELESLKVFSNLCKKIGVEFFLYGGSLLGAIKYHGFIPWDDDLDIAMMREDYEKLIKFGPSMLNEEYELQHPKINKITPYPYIKFRRKDTKMVEYIFHRLDMNHGIYFDIYPIDNIPDDETLVKKQNRLIKILVILFWFRQNKDIGEPVKNPILAIRYLLKSIIYYTLRLIPHTFFIQKFDKIMCQYNNIKTQRQGNYFFPKPVNFFDGIYPLINIEFDSFEMKIPKGYAINLRNRYGDISQLPPKNKRIGHRPYILRFGEQNED